jgi:Zn-finger nucleic acid-binding protein
MKNLIGFRRMVRVCPDCGAEAIEKASGDESLTFCSANCGCLEDRGQLEEITEDEFFKRGEAWVS